MSTPQNMSISQLARNLFSQEPGELGIIRLPNTDNQHLIETLLSILADGLTHLQKDFSDFLDSSFMYEINKRLSYLGFNIKLEVVPYDQGTKLVHFCSINSDNQFRINPFHPFYLMKGMPQDKIPVSYMEHYTNVTFLHQVMAVCRVDDGIIVFRFFPVNIQENEDL